MIDISRYSKAQVLAALYNASKGKGLGLYNVSSARMTEEQAQELLSKTTQFDYLQGRVMKIDLGCDTLEEWLYDRDNGNGAAARAISHLPTIEMTEKDARLIASAIRYEKEEGNGVLAMCEAATATAPKYMAEELCDIIAEASVPIDKNLWSAIVSLSKKD